MDHIKYNSKNHYLYTLMLLVPHIFLIDPLEFRILRTSTRSLVLRYNEITLISVWAAVVRTVSFLSISTIAQNCSLPPEPT